MNARAVAFTIPAKVSITRLSKKARPRLRAKLLKMAAGIAVVFTAAEASDLRLMVDLLS